MRSAVEGIRAVAGTGDIALIMGLAVAQTFTRGALTVLTVVVAIDLLGTGEPGVGILTAAIGAGAVLGSLGASLLVGTRRLGAWYAVGVALWGVPVTLIGVFPQQARGAGPARLRRRRQRADRPRRLHAPGQAGAGRGAGAGLRRAGEPGRPVHRGRGDRHVAADRAVRRTSRPGDRRSAVSGLRGGRRGGGCDAWTGPSTSAIATSGCCRRWRMLNALPLPAIEQLARGLEPVQVPAGQHRRPPGRRRRPLLRDRVGRGRGDR